MRPSLRVGFGQAAAGTRPTDEQLSTHKLFLVQFFNGPFCFFQAGHFNEREAFRALVVAVTDDFCHVDAANSAEETE